MSHLRTLLFSSLALALTACGGGAGGTTADTSGSSGGEHRHCEHCEHGHGEHGHGEHGHGEHGHGEHAQSRVAEVDAVHEELAGVMHGEHAAGRPAAAPTVQDFKVAAEKAGWTLDFQDLDELARYCLQGVREQRFVIMIRVEEAAATLLERAARIGRSELPIDQAEIPQL